MDGSGYDGYDCAWVDRLQGPGTTPPEPDPLALALDCSYSFTAGGSGGVWGTQSGEPYPYYGPDMAQSAGPGDDQESWMQTTVTVNDGDKMSFYWKVFSDVGDYLEFYIGAVRQDYISGEVDWQKKSYTFSGSGTKTLKWRYVKDSQDSAGDDRGWVDGLVIGDGSLVQPPDAYAEEPYSEVLDCDLKFTSTTSDIYGSTWSANSSPMTAVYYLDGDSAQSDSPDHDNDSCLQTIVESTSAETIKFYWKVSSEQNSDYLQFYIDSTLKDQISGNVGWQQKSYSVTSGTHILKWRYVKDSSGSSGSDCAWVDFVQWSGPSPAHDPSNWQEIAYKHDVLGRRVEKKVDGYSTRYVYDGPHVIAEYDGNNNLLRKYIYGPGIDQPVSMIEVADANATYYYHFDALGSVVALSDAAGDTVQSYQYSVYGEVAVEDANHPNPYMFAGVRYDIEIGLYYNRARYYNPFTGRFLQTDPADYKYGMNLYAYCGNRPSRFTDPSGLCSVCGNEGPDCEYLYKRSHYNDPCGWTVTTGNISTLPGVLDPKKVMTINALDAYMTAVRTAMGWTGTVGLAVDLWHQDWTKVAEDIVDPAAYIAGKYLEFMQKMTSFIGDAAYKSSGVWRAFFEVQDYRWKTENGELVRDEKGRRIKEKIGKPRWIEVINLEGWWGVQGARTGGYETIEAAYAAAVKGRDFFYCNELGNSVPADWYNRMESPGGDIYGGTTYTVVLPGFGP